MTPVQVLTRLSKLQQTAATLAAQIDTLRVTLEDNERTKSGRPEEVIGAVASVLGMRPTDLLSRTKAPIVVRARAVACLALRDAGRLSYPEIGRVMSRDHTTVIYAVKLARELLAEHDPTDRAARPYVAAYEAGVAAWDVDAGLRLQATAAAAEPAC